MTPTTSILIVDEDSFRKCRSSLLNSMIDPIARGGLPREHLFRPFPPAPC